MDQAKILILGIHSPTLLYHPESPRAITLSRYQTNAMSKTSCSWKIYDLPTTHRLGYTKVFFLISTTINFLVLVLSFKNIQIHNVATKEGELTSLLQLQCSLPIILTTAVEQLYQPQWVKICINEIPHTCQPTREMSISMHFRHFVATPHSYFSHIQYLKSQ